MTYSQGEKRSTTMSVVPAWTRSTNPAARIITSRMGICLSHLE